MAPSTSPTQRQALDSDDEGALQCRSETHVLKGQDGNKESFTFPTGWTLSSDNLLSTLHGLIHSDGDADVVKQRASALLRTVEWDSADYNLGRKAAGKRPLNDDQVFKRVHRMPVVKDTNVREYITIDSDDDDGPSTPVSDIIARNAARKRRRVGGIKREVSPANRGPL
ncbi:hypothetical protein TARUN_4697 [Trichoderma arundinaceum]|uniref:Uncharacterized protein n=1 Tax=Trichoderma arundinaceum TaxID=490622 RepID=A0A395NNW9_TRIAR|nr:hypothetical protein TARUN_4697 [Trichoderma arundinaceum]